MKTIIIYSMLLLVGALSACSSEDNFAPETSQPGSGAIELTVSAGNFFIDGASHTRATESDAGTTISFSNGDRIGLIIVVDNGVTLVANNVPYKYDGTNWAFDAENTESKTAPNYDTSIKNVTYIAYYPYSPTADGVTTLEGLKGKFAPKLDQSKEADYRASDLLVWTLSVASPQNNLVIALTHAYASISLLTEVKYMLDDGRDTPFPSPPLSDINFTIGSDICFPFQAKDGSYRYIFPAGISAVRWFYTLGNKSYGSSKVFADVASANTRYIQNEKIEYKYTLASARVGDVYCKNTTGAAYLIPGDIEKDFFTEDVKKECLGVVFFIGQHDLDASDYSLSGIKQKKCHGYVVALKFNEKGVQWGVYGVIAAVSSSTTDWNGYSNHQILVKQGIDNYYAAKECNNYTPTAPVNSSGWFLPSAGQLKTGLADNKTLIDKVMGNVGGIIISQSRWTWSSTVGSNLEGEAWTVGIDNGAFDDGDRLKSVCAARAVLAF